ncbi:radical SAM protein [Longispora sp. K20-0274]|uniref:radical SAM protein n=1 Tax=Longispora sp. K20-0274 TaxID=3088255 RepID=UPI0039999897
MLQPSRYVVVGRTAFRHPAGHVVRPVLQAATARVFLVDPVTADRLAGGPALPDEAERALRAAGLLVATGTDEPAAVIAAARGAAGDTRERRFVVMPTSWCNMSCAYCGQEHTRGATTKGHRDQLAARFSSAVHSGRYDAAHVAWFGAEPMAGYAVVLDLSRRFTAAADDAGVSYRSSMVTNGALLDARKLAALYDAGRLRSVEVTLDGPAAAHDASRPLKRGGGSFDHVVRVIAAGLAAHPDLRWRVRTNVGVGNAHLAGEFAAAMAAAGLADPRVGFYPAPLHPWGNDVTAVALDRARMAEVELAWLAAYARHGLTTSLLPARPKGPVCIAVTPHAEVVSPDGGVYSCTEQPLVPGFTDRRVGTLSTVAEGPRPAGEFDDWADALDADETGCRGCRILPLCGGACPKLWREGQVPCPPLKHNVPGRLDLYALSAGCTPL